MKGLSVCILAFSATAAFAGDFQQVHKNSKGAMNALYQVQGDAALVCKGARGSEPAKSPFDTPWQSEHLRIVMNNETTYSIEGNLVSEGNYEIASAKVEGDSIYLVVQGPDADEGAAEVVFSLKEISGKNSSRLAQAFASVSVTGDSGDEGWAAGSERWTTDPHVARYRLFCDLE